VEFRHAVLEVVRIQERGGFLVVLGCRFIHPPPPISATLRARVAAHLAATGYKSR
jgi:hypothetical protein